MFRANFGENEENQPNLSQNAFINSGYFIYALSINSFPENTNIKDKILINSTRI